MKYSVITIIILFFTAKALAQEGKHVCKHPLSPTQVRINGKALNIQAGDTICLLAGRKPFAHFSDLLGTPEKPIIIQNCGGKVAMGGPAVKDAIMLLNSRYVRITGTGDKQESCGIFIEETKPGSQGIQITSFSSDVEIDHVEIQNAGFAGIMAKTDPLCSGASDRGAFTMTNISIHDNYIHDSKGEGIYLGNSFYTGTEVYCESFHLPHEVKHVRVYNNRVENSGWEAIQVGSAVEDCEIYGNRILKYGQADKRMQNNGIQVGKGTTGRVYKNIIKEGPGAAIVIQGIGNNYIYNNLIISPGSEAFNINTREPLKDKGVYIINNTVLYAETVLREHINDAKNNVFFNNLIVGAGADWNQLKPYTDWKLENNVFLTKEEAAFFDPSAEDYRLKNTVKTQGIGKQVTAYSITEDFRGIKRNVTTPDIGAFQHN